MILCITWLQYYNLQLQRGDADLFKTKYYKLQAELEDAEQRKEHAVKALMARARARNAWSLTH